MEVQTAARIVAKENQHLRALLHQLGVSEDAVNRWLSSRKGHENSEDEGYRWNRNSSRVAWSDGNMEGPRSGPQSHGNDERLSHWRQTQCPVGDEIVSPDTHRPGISDFAGDPVDMSSNMSPRVSASNANFALGAPTLNKESQGSYEANRHDTTKAAEGRRQQKTSPCKNLSRLTTDSASDEPPVLPDVPGPHRVRDGISCSVAYDLLKRHATCDEKIEALGRVLEEGCEPGSGGSCHVKHEVVAQALVDLCL